MTNAVRSQSENSVSFFGDVIGLILGRVVATIELSSD